MSEIKGTIKVLRHESKVLARNPAGDSACRDLCLYLPPEYAAESARRFPVVYCLTGFTGRGKMFLNDNPFSKNLAERLDIMITQGDMIPVIAVMPDCFTRYGGSQYINSPATGNYRDYLTKEITGFVDSNFRTIPDPEARAVVGKSSGGYGALVMAMRGADTFRHAASISGDCYFEMCYKPDFRNAFRAIGGDPIGLLEKFWDEEMPKEKKDYDGLNVIGMSACYSPDPASPFGFDLPFDLETGEILEEVWNRWLTHDPVRMVTDSLENLKKMRLIFIDAGTRDEFGLDIGARVLSDRLHRSGIAHVTEEFGGGHFNINHRYNKSFGHISKSFLESGAVGEKERS